MVYQWKIPELYSVSAQEAGAEIESCKNGDGFITPAAVVQRAKESTSVIHGCFEWDDARAAERYRLNQAGELIRNIVTVIEEEKTPLTVRAFVNIKGEDESGYKTISAVVSNCNEYEYLLRTALSDMAAFTRKYEILKELRGVMTAMKEVLADEIT